MPKGSVRPALDVRRGWDFEALVFGSRCPVHFPGPWRVLEG